MATYLIQNGKNVRGTTWDNMNDFLPSSESGAPVYGNTFTWEKSVGSVKYFDFAMAAGQAYRSVALTGWNSAYNASNYAKLHIEGYCSIGDSASVGGGRIYLGENGKNAATYVTLPRTNGTVSIDLPSYKGNLMIYAYMYVVNYHNTYHAYIKNMWLTANYYTITYDANGGSGAPAAQTLEAGTINLSSDLPSRTGYTFQGWAKSQARANAGTVDYSAGQQVSLTGNLNLWAVWKIITYTITYNANGGSGAPASQTKDYGATITLSDTIPSWTGRNFIGWAKSSTGSVEYQPRASYSGNANLNLYAKWELQTWEVTYDANGGSGAPSAQTKIYGENLTLSKVKPSKTSQSAGSYIVTLNGNNGSVSPSQLTAARTSNYSFNIWNTKSGGNGTNYSPGQTYSTNASLGLYAQWNTNTTTASVALPTNPSRTGYTFLGWNDSASASTGTTGYYTPTENVTLYAIWKTQSKIYIDSNLVTNAYLGIVPIKKIYLNETVLFEQD